MLSVIFLAMMVGCGENEESVSPQNDPKDIIAPHCTVAGSISYSYMIAQGEVCVNDTNTPIELGADSDILNPTYWIIFDKIDKFNVSVTCGIYLDGKVYQMVIPHVEVSGRACHVNFNTETDAEFYVDDTLSSRGMAILTGLMNVYGCDNPDCGKEHHITLDPTSMDYTCNLTINYTSETESIHLKLKELICREYRQQQN